MIASSLMLAAAGAAAAACGPVSAEARAQARTENNAGMALYRQGRFVEAAQRFRAAAGKDCAHLLSRTNLAASLARAASSGTAAPGARAQAVAALGEAYALSAEDTLRKLHGDDDYLTLRYDAPEFASSAVGRAYRDFRGDRTRRVETSDKALGLSFRHPAVLVARGKGGCSAKASASSRALADPAPEESLGSEPFESSLSVCAYRVPAASYSTPPIQDQLGEKVIEPAVAPVKIDGRGARRLRYQTHSQMGRQFHQDLIEVRVGSEMLLIRIGSYRYGAGGKGGGETGADRAWKRDLKDIDDLLASIRILRE